MKLKTTAAFCIFLISAIILKAQDTLPTQPKLIIRTHPVSFFGKGYNIGFEYKLRKKIFLTSALFKPAFLDPTDLLEEQLETYFFSSDIKGYTVRLGLKYQFPVFDETEFYIEPQCRYGKISKNIYLNTEPYYNFGSANREKRFQTLILLGMKSKYGKNFFIECYVGVGKMLITGKGIITDSSSTNQPIGMTWDYKGNFGQFYLGMAISFNINTRKSKKT